MKGMRREWIESFLEAVEEERYRIDTSQSRPPKLGELYGSNRELFSLGRITEVQRALAGASGSEERRMRTVLAFLADGRASCVAGGALDHRLTWEVLGAVEVADRRIPHRQIPAALGLTADPEERHAIEDAHLAVLHEQRYRVEEAIDRQREGFAELGYGSHVDSSQILAGIDYRAIAAEGERFLAKTDEVYRELLAWHLPRLTGTEAGVARASDGERLEAAAPYSADLKGGERHRTILDTVEQTGLNPSAEGRLRIEWEVYLANAAGAVSCAPRVPDRVQLAVSTRAGRAAVASFLREYGWALHHAYTDPNLPLEERRLGDASVPDASGKLLEGLLRTPSFLTRIYGLSGDRLREFVRLETLLVLLGARREIARLRFELAFYEEGAGPEDYAALLSEATGLRHDPRAALWSVSGDFAPAGRLRAMQLGAVHTSVLRNRFDEDWFRNPKAGGYLKDLFANGRRYTAPELATQLSSEPFGYGYLLSELQMHL